MLQLTGLFFFWTVHTLFDFQTQSRDTSSALSQYLLLNLFLAIGITLGSTIIARHSLTRPTWEMLAPDQARRIIELVMAFASLGVILRIADRFLIRPSLVGSNIDITGTDSNVVGALASLLYPVGVTALPFLVAFGRGYPRRFWIIASLLFAFPAFDVLIVGKRGLALTIFSMLALLLMSSGLLKRWRVVVASFGFGLLTLAVFSWIFAQRIGNYGFSMCFSLFHSGYATFIRPNSAIAGICGTEGVFASFMGYVTNFGMYFIHGFYEFAYGFSQSVNSRSLSWGLETFGVLLKPICSLAPDLGVCEIEAGAFREGVYTTFWGPWTQDFGAFSLFFAFIFGLLLALVRSAALTSFAWYPLYLYLGVVVFFMPTLNLIHVGLGVYVIIGCFIFAIVFSRGKKKNDTYRFRGSS